MAPTLSSTSFRTVLLNVAASTEIVYLPGCRAGIEKVARIVGRDGAALISSLTRHRDLGPRHDLARRIDHSSDQVRC